MYRCYKCKMLQKNTASNDKNLYSSKPTHTLPYLKGPIPSLKNEIRPGTKE